MAIIKREADNCANSPDSSKNDKQNKFEPRRAAWELRTSHKNLIEKQAHSEELLIVSPRV